MLKTACGQLDGREHVDVHRTGIDADALVRHQGRLKSRMAEHNDVVPMRITRPGQPPAGKERIGLLPQRVISGNVCVDEQIRRSAKAELQPLQKSAMRFRKERPRRLLTGALS